MIVVCFVVFVAIILAGRNQTKLIVPTQKEEKNKTGLIAKEEVERKIESGKIIILKKGRQSYTLFKTQIRGFDRYQLKPSQGEWYESSSLRLLEKQLLNFGTFEEWNSAEVKQPGRSKLSGRNVLPLSLLHI